MQTRDSIRRKRSPFYGPERFSYEPENNRHICPAGQPLNYGGRSHRNHAYTYILGHANGVGRARSGGSAPVLLFEAWSSISTNRHGNAHGNS